MKKLLSILFVIMLTVTLMSLSVLADSYNPNDHCDLEISLKKADPANVIKDGIIGENEYIQVDVSNDPDDTFLNIGYCNMSHYEMAEFLLKTATFYVSWDEVHGFNFAMKFKPNPDHFVMDSDEGYSPKEDCPEDNFLCQLGFTFISDPDIYRDMKKSVRPYFYYAVGKKTTDGTYVTGHYNQFGPSGHYDPVAGQDYCIVYSGEWAICEWSIPFDTFTTGVSKAGDTFYASLSLSNGDAPANIVQEEVQNYFASISLGDFGYGVRQNGDSTHCTWILSDEAVYGMTSGGNNDETGGNGGGNNEAVTAIETYLTTNENGETVVETRIVEKNVSAGNEITLSGKRTGDPMIIFAALSAVSACSIALLKKKH